jgi:ribosomal protein L7/L12
MTLFLIAFVVVAVIFAFTRNRNSQVNDPHPPAPPAKNPAAGPASGSTDNPVEDADVISMIRSGNKIDAIRMYRELHGTDLVTAKDAVEALAKTL